MPEWPEMETYRTMLTDKLAGAKITGTEVTRDKSINVSAEQFELELVGQSIWYVEHRGKHLIFHLESGKRLLLHLMLGGMLVFTEGDAKPDRTVQVTIRFAHGSLHFIGLRLGYLHLLTVKQTLEKLSELGPDPFDKRLDEQAFRGRFAGRRGKLKPVLTDQSVIAGIGNCYADEIAFEAGVRPIAPIPAIRPETWQRLYDAMQNVLTEATRSGGYMERPFHDGDTLTGGYNDKCRVYDREGEPCYRCGTPIVREEAASRKLFYCPGCQHGE